MVIDRASLRGKVQTVSGVIAPEALAATLMHEHVLCDITPPSLAALNDPGPEITLENVYAINYGKVSTRPSTASTCSTPRSARSRRWSPSAAARSSS